MIDLHNHVLPGLDDGAATLEESLDMARIWIADGVHTVACTPHILPGVYSNNPNGISEAIGGLRLAFALKGLEIKLVAGADNHVVPDFVQALRTGRLPTLAGSRYTLVEPPHQVKPPRLSQLMFDILVAGYVPVLTHPERLAWVETSYTEIVDMARKGVWMQITSGSLLGHFGRRAQYWAERMLDDRIVDILASDAHGAKTRAPCLAAGAEAAAQRIGEAEATKLVVTRPQAILDNAEPSATPRPFQLTSNGGASRVSTNIGVEDAVSTFGGEHTPARSSSSGFGRLRQLFVS